MNVLGFFKTALSSFVRVSDIEPLPVAVIAAAAVTPVLAATARPGISSDGSVGVASAQIIAAGTYLNNVIVQNTHATQVLNLSFTNPATATSFKLAVGASVALPFGPSNTLYALGSGAATTYAIVGA